MNTKATLAILTLTLVLSAAGCMPHYGHARPVRYVGSPVRAPVRVLVPHAFGPRVLGMAPTDDASVAPSAFSPRLALEAIQIRQIRPETKNLSTLLSGLVATVGRARNLELANHVNLHLDAGVQVARLGMARAHDDNWDRSTPSPSWELPDARSAAHLGPRANGNGPYANVALTVEL